MRRAVLNWVEVGGWGNFYTEDLRKIPPPLSAKLGAWCSDIQEKYLLWVPREFSLECYIVVTSILLV